MQSIYSSEQAFSALKADGSVVAWGEAKHQAKAVLEPLNKLQESGVITCIARNENATAASKADGRVVVWGKSEYSRNLLRTPHPVCFERGRRAKLVILIVFNLS